MQAESLRGRTSPGMVALFAKSTRLNWTKKLIVIKNFVAKPRFSVYFVCLRKYVGGDLKDHP